MMDGGLLSLKWNNHRSTFFYVLSNVRKKECYTDVTLACDGKFYPVHKLILSTCSEYFEQMFEQTQCKHPVIVLKDIRSEELESLLSYMYVGEVNVVQEKLSGLIKAAECLRIKGLAVPDEEPQPTKSSGGSREKRTSDNSLSSEAKRRRQDDSTFSSQKQTSSSSNREDSNRRRVDQSSSNKFNRNNASSSSSSGSVNSSRDNRENVSERTSGNRDVAQSDEQQPSATSEAGDDEIELKAEEPPDPEEDLHSEMPPSDAADAVKQEPIDLDAVYLSDSNSASETKDMLVEDSFGEADGQQHFMDELLGQNSASDQHGGVGDYGEGGEGSSSSGAPSNQQQQHMVHGQTSAELFSTSYPSPDRHLLHHRPGGAPRFNLPAQNFTTSRRGEVQSRPIASHDLLAVEYSEHGAADDNCSFVTPYSYLDIVRLRDADGSIVCPVCFIKIRHANHFPRHYRLHTGEKRYSCTLCDYKATRKDHLTRHIHKSHPSTVTASSASVTSIPSTHNPLVVGTSTAFVHNSAIATSTSASNTFSNSSTFDSHAYNSSPNPNPSTATTSSL